MVSRGGILIRIRGRVAEALAALPADARAARISGAELQYASFAPSRLTRHFCVSDNPIPSAIYLSVVDGYCYHLHSADELNDWLVALRFRPWRLLARQRRGHAVGITEDAWIENRLVLIAVSGPTMRFDQGLVSQFGEMERKVLVNVLIRVMLRHWWEYLTSGFVK